VALACMMRSQCSDLVGRVTREECHCPIGLFSSPVASSEGVCTQRGVDVWKQIFNAYTVVMCFGFLVILGWCMVQRSCLHDRSTRQTKPAILSFCFAASVTRIGYLIAEAVLVQNTSPDSHPFWDKLGWIFYTSFFPLSTAAFLCVCQHWLRLIYVIDEISERPWHRNPLYIACLGLLVVELLRDFWVLIGMPAFFKVIYFMWLLLVGIIVELVGIGIARRLYGRLRAWIVGDSFRATAAQGLWTTALWKVQLSAAMMSVVTLCFLVLCGFQALVGRFHPWPCLTCWAVGHVLEVVNLALILRSVSGVRERSDSSLPTAGNSFDSLASAIVAPTMIEAMWMGVPSHSGVLRDRPAQIP